MSKIGLSAIVATSYMAAQGDTLRLVCHRYYGRSDTAIVSMVAKRNPYILEKLTFDAGDVVIFPSAPNDTISTNKTVALWDNLAFINTAKQLPIKKTPTRIPTVKLLAALDAYRRRKIIPVLDEEDPPPRPPLPHYTAMMDWKELNDPYSLYTDLLANLR